MITPLLHTKTKANLDTYLKSPSQAIILVGEDGLGKYFVALWLAQELGSEQITVAVAEDKQLISIDQVKNLYTQTRTGTQLVLIVKDAHLMSRDAQNAFLKLLEEPPQNTLFILTAKSERDVLQTIASRCQVIQVIPPLEKEVSDYLYANALTLLPEIELLPLLKTTSGNMGSLSKLLSDGEQSKAHTEIVQISKQFYSADSYTRLQIALDHGFDKIWAKQLIDILAIIIQTLLPGAANESTRLAKIQSQIELIEQSAHALSVSGSPKAHLTRLAVLL